MREIKFRLLHPDTKKFAYSSEIHWPGTFFPHLSAVPPPDQYTGLKDSQGIEIYEGDIVEAKGGRGIMAVVWKWDRYWGERRKRKDDPDTWDTGVHYPIRDSHRLTIIGNIHQNPELVEEKK